MTAKVMCIDRFWVVEMKKIFGFLLIILVIVAFSSTQSIGAPKKGASKKSSIPAAELVTMNETADNLIKKVYSNSLFSPQENEQMISIKMKLDDAMLVMPDVTLAPLYYKVANLYKMRNYKNEAIDCYQTILENFADTALAPKARKELAGLGVVVAEPIDPNAAEAENPSTM